MLNDLVESDKHLTETGFNICKLPFQKMYFTYLVLSSDLFYLPDKSLYVTNCVESGQAFITVVQVKAK